MTQHKALYGNLNSHTQYVRSKTAHPTISSGAHFSMRSWASNSNQLLTILSDTCMHPPWTKHEWNISAAIRCGAQDVWLRRYCSTASCVTDRLKQLNAQWTTFLGVRLLWNSRTCSRTIRVSHYIIYEPLVSRLGNYLSKLGMSLGIRYGLRNTFKFGGTRVTELREGEKYSIGSFDCLMSLTAAYLFDLI